MTRWSRGFALSATGLLLITGALMVMPISAPTGVRQVSCGVSATALANDADADDGVCRRAAQARAQIAAVVFVLGSAGIVGARAILKKRELSIPAEVE